MVGARSTPGHQRVWLWRVSQPGETTKGTLHGARGKRPLSVSFAYGTTNAGDDEHISEKDVMSDAFWIALFAGLPAIIAAVVSAMTARHQAKLAGRQEELIVKTSTVETKIDNNTAITRSGTAVAAPKSEKGAKTTNENRR